MTNTPTIHERITADMRAAMKLRNITTVATLRTLMAAIDNASAVAVTSEHVSTVGRSSDVPRRVLTENDVREVLRADAASRRVAADEFERGGQVTHAAKLRQEVELIHTYIGDR